MTVLIFREYRWEYHDKGAGPLVAAGVLEPEAIAGERVEWRLVPGEHEDRTVIKKMMREQSVEEEVRFAIYEEHGEVEPGLPQSYEFSEIVKWTPPPVEEGSLRKVSRK